MYKVQELMNRERTVYEPAATRNFDATKASAKRSSSYSNVLPSRSSWNHQENNGNQSGSRATQAKGSPGGRRAPSPPRAATRRCPPASPPQGRLTGHHCPFTRILVESIRKPWKFMHFWCEPGSHQKLCKSKYFCDFVTFGCPEMCGLLLQWVIYALM